MSRSVIGFHACCTNVNTMRKLLEQLKEDYPEAKVVGHRDLPGVKGLPML